ncbi:hypothetical protein RI129_011400 [Pyrocoelia pectoralis]|uniref:C2H2-type domain-containing protein n=1 Tax=Pyrocoelia pectoralis TaxID=417401 RepID=A0AAN7VB35_9COLE
MDNSSNDLLYILDNSQCINEVVIEDEGEIREIDSETSPIMKSEGGEVVTVEHIEHGYMLPSVFKGQLQSKKRYKRRDDDLSSVNIGEEESAIEAILTSEATSSKSTPTLPKARPKRRHEVPDFSATNYIMLNPTDEIDIVHYKCLRCEQLFISKFGFFRHIEKGRCYINSCDVCSASFNKNSEFYEHYMAEHTDRAICNFCFRTFMYEKNVKEHMLRHLDQFRHRCEQCNKGFYTVREYRNHYKNRHMGIRHKHKCQGCERTFDTKATMENHHRRVHLGVTFKCLDCNKVYTSENYLKIHQRTHLPDYVPLLLTCYLCHAKFLSKQAIKVHLKSHKLDQQYICHACGKRIKSLYSFRNHLRIHSGEKPFKCKECEKGFSAKKYLIAHVRVHTKEKPFCCSLCPKRFTQRSTLGIHLRQHTGERPYSCNVCDKTFASKTSLNSHMRTHKCVLRSVKISN